MRAVYVAAPDVVAAAAADLPPETEEPVPPRDTPLSHILTAFARKISHRRDALVADTNYRSYRSYRGYVTEAAIFRIRLASRQTTALKRTPRRSDVILFVPNLSNVA